MQERENITTRPAHLTRDYDIGRVGENDKDPCRVSTLEQFSCRPDILRGTVQNPKWICVPIHRFFKLCPSESSNSDRLISVEIHPSLRMNERACKPADDED
ncbi:hypothetical protein Pst134EA_011240 [Puccinia striiformis f. sp. tritici]|uniref:hypothetical protein n=1 Tax=Puccinia striiformis f. sp. tritici TaxID=168172 RepID=UPI00200845F8|nr:hypothetical protein Pst134EA_011240 [Puccinia striiformis f. sp. tritici]KAH9467601.1 hypothetical protein Pst134EA_011240 [Puccinia striiformis f. sp. tritici]KAI9608210.1 hypothetical protein KEM48_003343 [Puccinia striiformis f. sp. tritici PST-130]